MCVRVSTTAVFYSILFHSLSLDTLWNSFSFSSDVREIGWGRNVASFLLSYVRQPACLPACLAAHTFTHTHTYTVAPAPSICSFQSPFPTNTHTEARNSMHRKSAAIAVFLLSIQTSTTKIIRTEIHVAQIQLRKKGKAYTSAPPSLRSLRYVLHKLRSERLECMYILQCRVARFFR